jgi:hypothetical protein
MKKIFLLLAMAGTVAFTGCNNDDDRPDKDTISPVIELDNVDFTSANNFTVFYEFGGEIFDADVVLVYRLINVEGFDVWQQIPRTLYLDNGGEIDYDFNFTPNDVEIFMGANDLANLNALPGYTQDQIFRIVKVPGYFAGTVDVNNYDAVMSALESNGNEVQVIER